MSTTPPADIASPGVNSSPEKEEDGSTHTLRRSWQRYAQSVIHADRTVEKVKDAASKKELDDAIIGVLRTNVDLRRTITYIEAKLTGQAQETEALEGCMRSQPCVGRKRKRAIDEIQDGKSETATKETSGSS